MDGYAICQDPNQHIQRITCHASTQTRLIQLLEECVPKGSRISGIVLSYGSQIQARPVVALVS